MLVAEVHHVPEIFCGRRGSSTVKRNLNVQRRERTLRGDDGRFDDGFLDLPYSGGDIGNVRKISRVTDCYGSVPVDNCKRRQEISIHALATTDETYNTFVWDGGRRDDDICIILVLEPLAENIHM